MTNKHSHDHIDYTETSPEVSRIVAEAIKSGIISQPEDPVIVQLKKELAEARECELLAKNWHFEANIIKWQYFQAGLRRAIEIVEKGK